MKKRETLYKENTGYFDQPLADFLKTIHQIKKDAKKKGYSNLRIDFEDEWGYYDEHWINMVISGERKISVKEFVESKD